jgi:hypothetical protein
MEVLAGPLETSIHLYSQFSPGGATLNAHIICSLLYNQQKFLRVQGIARTGGACPGVPFGHFPKSRMRLAGVFLRLR